MPSHQHLLLVLATLTAASGLPPYHQLQQLQPSVRQIGGYALPYHQPYYEDHRDAEVTPQPAPPPQQPSLAPPPNQQITFEDEPQVLPADRLQALRPVIERGLLELCLALERTSNSLDSTENTVLAPLSVAAIAALLLAGSSGQTRKELEKVFGVDNIPHRGEELHNTLGKLFTQLEAGETIGSILYGFALFVQEGEPLSPDYLSLARGTYRSEVISLDFKRDAYNASMFINKWVSNRTEGKIESLLQEAVPPSTSIIIANAFFFRGKWEQPFVERYTKMQKFFVSRSETLFVPLMTGMMRVPFARVRGSHSIVGLPYKGGQSIMYFILPDISLRKFIAGITPESLRSFINQTTVQQTVVAIPKMRIEGSQELSRPLTSIGVGSVFRPGVADLPGIGPSRKYYVTEMLHKVSLEITETGTTGAAATAVTILRDGSTPLFRADRPFIFFHYHEPTGSIIFWGTVFRPQPISDNSSL